MKTLTAIAWLVTIGFVHHWAANLSDRLFGVLVAYWSGLLTVLLCYFWVRWQPRKRIVIP